MFYLLGLVGHPVEHSLSPPMHKAALSHFGLEGDYKLIDLTAHNLEEGIAQLRQQKFVGFNVTIPHKQAVCRLTSELTPEAKQLSAVNTVKFDKDGRLVGHNTDVGGFMNALTLALPSMAKTNVACVVGSGGACRSAVWALTQLGWPHLQILARNKDACRQIKDEVENACRQTGSNLAPPQISLVDTELAGLDRMPDLVVNCTPIGLFNDEIPDFFEQLLKLTNPLGTFFDMVYARSNKSSVLIRLASRLRLNCVDGTQMLVEQAALSFDFWTAKRPPLAVMKQALIKARESSVQPDISQDKGSPVQLKLK